MWFWCNAPFGWTWWIFPIMFLVCLIMMFFCMRMFFGGHFGHHLRCCPPGRSAEERPSQQGQTDYHREER
jgi:hypothetical protein